MQPWQLVLVAYGIGILQDVIGQGVLGMHAMALAGGGLAATFVRAQLTNSGALERLLVVFVAVVGKWAVMALLLAWLVGGPYSVDRLGAVAAVEGALTVLAGLAVLPAGSAPRPEPRAAEAHLMLGRMRLLRPSCSRSGRVHGSA